MWGYQTTNGDRVVVDSGMIYVRLLPGHLFCKPRKAPTKDWRRITFLPTAVSNYMAGVEIEAVTVKKKLVDAF